jgi:glycerol-3-phosphate acyltransferase PlsX
MGAAMARTLLDKARPTVGLLNIGVEEVKGLEPIRLAGQMLKDASLVDLDYVGFIEADDIGKGKADVVVTEGFAGYIREAVNASLMAKLGFFLARGAFSRLRRTLDPSASNGGVFLGLNGIVIKSHGGTDAKGFAAAIDIGYRMARSKIVDEINGDLAAYRQTRMSVAPEAKTGAM